MINIKYDCPEANSEMAKTDCGFYCSSCSQEVYDFREKSIEEIAHIRANNPSVSCGIFTAEQAVINNRSGISNLFRIAFAAIFVLGLNVSTLFAQSIDQGANAIETTVEVITTNVFISGALKDEKGNRIAGWITCYYGEEVVSIDTDNDGNFEIELAKEVIGQTVVFSFSASGYHIKEIELVPKSSKCYTYQIELKQYKKPFLKRNRMIRGRF